jgi:hypothetical protein
MVTHFVEDVAEMATICGLTSLSDLPSDDDTSLDIYDCTCPQCLSVVIGDLTKRQHVTHLVEDVAEMATICGLTSLKDRPNEDTSLDIYDCTCPQCLSVVIGDLARRLKNINRTSVLQVPGTENKRNDGSNL